MLSIGKKTINQILVSDTRFINPVVTDDQVWKLTVEPGVHLSCSTTYGLRAKQISIFPEFTVDNATSRDPIQFFKYPRQEFQSVNFSELSFSPFPSIDACLKIWVPTSHIIVGQITCTNVSDSSVRVSQDWLVRLDPHPNGRIMSAAQMGINTVLQGNSSGLYPVFYLTGGPKESSSAYPGLVIDMLLIPGASRQITWVLASHNNAEFSFQQARHYSSHQLDVEQLKIEMADKRQKCMIQAPDAGNLPALLNGSQNQSFQLLMPAIRQFKHTTYMHERNPDHGAYLNEELLEINPEWSGQTLWELWMLAQNLLPGCPEVLKDLIQNELDSQAEDGRIDYRVSVNHKTTGILAPPMLAALVCELHPYLEDLIWLEQVYPKLILLLKNWFSNSSSFSPEFTHPLQTGLPDSSDFAHEKMVEFWIKLKSSHHPYTWSTFYHEVKCLIQIAGWLRTGDDLPWLDQIRAGLEDVVEKTWNDPAGRFECRDSSSGLLPAGKRLCEFKKSGFHKPARKITTPGKLFIRLNLSSRVSPDFSCTPGGLAGSHKLEIALNSSSFHWIGSTGIFVTDNAFSSLESIEVKGFKPGDIGVVGQVGLQQPDILALLPLWAGVISPQNAEKLLAAINLEQYLSENGICLTPKIIGEPPVRIPNFLAAMLIEGLLQYRCLDLAMRFFHNHFDPAGFMDKNHTLQIESIFSGSVENLIPVKLFLELCGIKKITARELIITHFNVHSYPVTVQYNQTKIVLSSDKTEIQTSSGNTIILDKVGPHRIIFE